MRQGLLLVLSHPDTVPLADFHDWYDHEHAPARAAFDDIENATRLQAVDGAEPGWLATYDLDLAVLERREYQALRQQRSRREREVIAGLGVFERRLYELVAEAPEPDGPDAWRSTPTGPVVIAVSLDVPADHEAEYHAWYAEEHVPLLHRIEGWHRTRRYRLLDAPPGSTAPRLLALHDVESADLVRDPRWAEATSTPRREALMARVSARERRVFAVHRRF